MPETKRSVLIVDDEPATRSLLSQIFTAMGHNVRAAEDGFTALQVIRESMPDILLSDLNMPGMSGFELLSIIRRRLPEIYVIATSGAYSGTAIPAGIAADAFYEKASSLPALLKLIDGAAREHSAAIERAEATTPIWVAANEQNEDELDVILGCPECLRCFRLVAQKQDQEISETECPYCFRTIVYAIVPDLATLSVRSTMVVR